MKIFIYNNKLTDLQKVRSVLELEGEICSLDPNINEDKKYINPNWKVKSEMFVRGQEEE